MLINLWANNKLRQLHEISFSYRKNKEYTQGLLEQMTPDFPVFPMVFPAEDWPKRDFQYLPSFVSKAIRFLFRTVTKIPFLVIDIFKLTILIKRIAPDVVHINNGGYPAALSARAATIAARIAGVDQIIMVVNNLAENYKKPDRWFDYPVDRFVVRATDLFITGSIVAAKQLEKVLSLSEGSVTSINNGIYLKQADESQEITWNRFQISKDFDGIIFGVVALMEPRKGHNVIIDAVEGLLAKRPEIIEKIIVLFEGDGFLKDTLKELVDRKKLSKIIHFIGKEENIANMMNAIDVLVLPSIGSEDFPNVTVEAMGFGKSAIASSLAGIPEQHIHRETGVLVDPGNSEALASAMTEVVDKPELFKSMGEEGKKRFIKMFTPDIAVSRYLDIYNKSKGQMK